MNRWSDSGSWVGEELRRDVFHFPSQGVNLYGSVYSPSTSEATSGIVICNAWGFEGNQMSRIVHGVSLAFARAGGVAFSFHYPGFGDSFGDFEQATIETLTVSVADALREAARRHPGVSWTLAGLRLGAALAALASVRDPGARRLLLVQPVLRPSRHFDRLQRASRRSQPPRYFGVAFGYRLTAAVLESAAAADADVDEALASFSGEGTVVRYAEPEPAGMPERFEQVLASGVWRFGSRDHPALLEATAAWLRRPSGVLSR
jgi:hypothetical protein